MLNFNINLTSLAVVLWSGMLIISGSIWILSSQVRKLADILEDRAKAPAPSIETICEVRITPSAGSARVARRGAPVRVRGGRRTGAGTSRRLAQLATPRRNEGNVGRLAIAEDSATA